MTLFVCCKSKPTAPPNIIVFLTDDLGYGDLPSYGHPIIKTPNIDKLASEGVLLTDCHSGGTVCSPSRAALLTGRNPYRSGFYYIAGAFGAKLESEEVTIPEMLKTVGYESAFMGKWHLSKLEKNRVDEPGPGDQGFDYWMATTVNAFEGPQNPKKFIRNGKKVGEMDGWYCDVIVEEASTWLTEKRDPSKPFFLMVSTHEPHTPIAPPKKYIDMYDNAETEELTKSIQYGSVDRPPYEISQYAKEYYGTVSQLDHAFGQLMKTLDEMGESDNTVVIFTSDNGPEHPVNLEESKGTWEDPIRDKSLGTPGILRGMKRYPFEGGHRVPGIVRWPNQIKPGSTSDELINGTDFFPIIASMAGANISGDIDMDGIDATKAFFGDEVDRKDPVLWIFPTHEDTYFRMPHISMRKDQYALLGWFPEKKDSVDIIEWMKTSIPERFMLTDLSNDLEQSKDISEENPQLLERMSGEMTTEWLKLRDSR